jgi:hypothetical protein
LAKAAARPSYEGKGSPLSIGNAICESASILGTLTGEQCSEVNVQEDLQPGTSFRRLGHSCVVELATKKTGAKHREYCEPLDLLSLMSYRELALSSISQE